MNRRVVSISHHPVFGGPHNQMARLAGPLERLGWSTVALLPTEPGNASQRLKDAGVDVVQREFYRLRASPRPTVQLQAISSLMRGTKAIGEVLAGERPDVVQINGLANPHGAIAARRLGLPVVWQLLDTRSPKLLEAALMPLVARCATVVMSTGSRVAERHVGYARIRTRVVPFFPPVDLAEFNAPDRDAARRRLGVRADLVVGVLGNRNPMKGHERFVEVAATVARIRRDVEFVILGAESDVHAGYARALDAQIASHGLRDRFRVVDPGASVANLLPAIDIGLFLSLPRSEGVPTAMLELMACSVPVIVSDVGGTPDVIADGENGNLVSAREPHKAAVEKVLALVDSADDRRRMGLAARRWVESHASVEQCAKVHAAAYERAVTASLLRT